VVFFCGCQVDVIYTNTCPTNDLQIRRSSENSRGDLRPTTDDQGIVSANDLQKLISRDPWAIIYLGNLS
jgi:hypothetical protein